MNSNNGIDKSFIDLSIKDQLQETDWVKVGNRHVKHVYFVPSDGSLIHQITIVFPDAQTI